MISKVLGAVVLPAIMKKNGTEVKLSVTFQTQAFEGAISFGSNGDALKPFYVVSLQDGNWTLLNQYAPQ